MSIETAFGIAIFGALVQELIYWYDARESLAKPKYTAMLSSKVYWAVTIAMVIASGIGTLVWVNFKPDVYAAKDLFILGAAFPFIVKKSTAAFRRGRAGSTLGASFTFNDLVGIW